MRRMAIVVDTREQKPLDFSGYEDVRVVRKELWPGDYSLEAASNFLAIERKSVSDLVGTMKDGYAGFTATTPKRFDRELKALRGYAARGCRGFVLVEPDAAGYADALDQIRAGDYRAMIPPKTVLAFVKAIRNGWGVPVVFAKSREHAARIVYEECRAVAAVREAFKAFDEI